MGVKEVDRASHACGRPYRGANLWMNAATCNLRTSAELCGSLRRWPWNAKFRSHKPLAISDRQCAAAQAVAASSRSGPRCGSLAGTQPAALRRRMDSRVRTSRGPDHRVGGFGFRYVVGAAAVAETVVHRVPRTRPDRASAFANRLLAKLAAFQGALQGGCVVSYRQATFASDHFRSVSLARLNQVLCGSVLP